MKRSVLALDFGASSGRAILATYDGTAIHLQEVHRFVNEPLLENGHLFWNVPELMNQLEIGLQKAFLLDSYESIGIDTWGVDNLKKWVDDYESTRFTPINGYTAVITSEYNMKPVREWLEHYMPIAEMKEL